MKQVITIAVIIGMLSVCAGIVFAGQVTMDDLYGAMNIFDDTQSGMAEEEAEGEVTYRLGSYVPATFWHLYVLGIHTDPQSKGPYAILGQTYERFKKDPRVVNAEKLYDEDKAQIFLDILLKNENIQEFARHIAIYQLEFHQKIRENVPYAEEVGTFVWGHSGTGLHQIGY